MRFTVTRGSESRSDLDDNRDSGPGPGAAAIAVNDTLALATGNALNNVKTLERAFCQCLYNCFRCQFESIISTCRG